MPEVDHAAYLLGHLFEVGPLLSGGMGPAPLSAQELLAWQQLRAITLSPWESATLMQLSRSYLSELQQASDPKRPAPWQPVDATPDFSHVARSMRASMLELANL